MILLFFFAPTVIARNPFSSLLTHLIVASWKSPAELHYPVSPFVCKVLKGVSISFLLLSKTLSRVSSSLFTLSEWGIDKDVAAKTVSGGLNWRLSDCSPPLFSFHGNLWGKLSFSFILWSKQLSTWDFPMFTGNQSCFPVSSDTVSWTQICLSLHPDWRQTPVCLAWGCCWNAWKKKQKLGSTIKT